ncbi:MAG TPA: formylglycine-generating enzyme family protein [Gemmataceae bacterium]|nr:formylglycine-generating enzyme family protein [Gemmataceae bacterium]
MKRLFHHPLIWGVFFLGLAVFCLIAAAPVPGDDKVPDKLPKVDPLKHKGYTETIPDSKIKFDMVPIPGGIYLMGSPKNEKGRRDDEGPQHPVAVRPFWMGKCEVTWEEYDLWWKEEGKEEKPKGKDDADAITRPTPPYADPTFGLGHEGQPALCMTHHAAMEYCRWLSKKTGKAYRLPTEAEWEWACRAGTTTAYSFGDDPSKLGDYAWFSGNSDDLPHKVGEKKPNPWGLHDMHGNIAEWCLDHYQKDSYATFPIDKLTLQPVLLPTEKRFSHVARGGAWNDPAAECRSAARRGSNKEWIKLDPQRPQSIWWLTSAEFVGFRIVCAVDEQANLKGIRSKVTKQSK